MGIPLLIFEKPKQAITVCKAFNSQNKRTHIEIQPHGLFPNGAIAVWCVGHIMKSKMPGEYKPEWKGWNISHLPIIPERFELVVDPSKRSNFNIIRKYVNDSNISEIYHYGDPAMEGQLLVDEVLEYVKNRKPVKRVWETSLTPSATIKAIKNAKDNKLYKSLYRAGQARQIADWVIGMNTSRCMSILAGEKGILDNKFPLGRCKTPLIKIIYRREIEIEMFKSKPYWDVIIKFKSKEGEYSGHWIKDQDEHIWNQSQAKALSMYCIDKPAIIDKIHKEKKEVLPPQFFNLTELQSEANKTFTYSPDKVLEIAQDLYLNGWITYPRAEPRVVSPEEAKDFLKILNSIQMIDDYKEFLLPPNLDISLDKRFVDASKVDDHHAIIPTEEVPNLESLTIDQRNIYNMVIQSFIAAHYPPAVYHHTEIRTLVDGHFMFVSKGKIELEKGWKQVLKKTETTDSPILPEVKEHEGVLVQDVEIREGKTTPPKRFTQGQLVKIMERAASHISKEERDGYTHDDMSLGTVATRAGIIKEVLKNNYISVKKNQVHIEPKGRMLMTALGEKNWLGSPVITGRMEHSLNAISKGKESVEPFLKATYMYVNNFIEQLKNESTNWDFEDEINQEQQKLEIGPCLLCGKPVVDKGRFYGCTGYYDTKCSFTFPKEIAKKPVPISEVKNLLSRKSTGLLTGLMGSKGPFEAYIVWDDKLKKHKFKS
ncbi:DNA topoisomerase [Rossellomorea sp. NPDC071047]|uniref:type IA DNA topoisomerase n=1 Tax=Rossellomorea sp. NPDC071047 TaxID=3390675 RepID=UPI003D07D593